MYFIKGNAIRMIAYQRISGRSHNGIKGKAVRTIAYQEISGRRHNAIICGGNTQRNVHLGFCI
jgi:hypothetical protein